MGQGESSSRRPTAKMVGLRLEDSPCPTLQEQTYHKPWWVFAGRLARPTLQESRLQVEVAHVEVVGRVVFAEFRRYLARSFWMAAKN